MRAIVTAIVLGLASVSAQAVPIRWTIQHFGPGESLYAGSFIYDQDTQLFSAVNVTSYPDDGRSGYGVLVTNGAIYTDVDAALRRPDGSVTLIRFVGAPVGTTGMVSYLVPGSFQPALANKCGDSAGCESGGYYDAGNGFYYSTLLSTNISSEIACNSDVSCPGDNLISYRQLAFQTQYELVGSPVPIPQAVWLFGSALSLMGVMRRKVAEKRDV